MFTHLFSPSLVSLGKGWLNVPSWMNDLLRVSFWLLCPRSRSVSLVEDKTDRAEIFLSTYWEFFQGTELCTGVAQGRLNHCRISSELVLFAKK